MAGVGRGGRRVQRCGFRLRRTAWHGITFSTTRMVLQFGQDAAGFVSPGPRGAAQCAGQRLPEHGTPGSKPECEPARGPVSGCQNRTQFQVAFVNPEGGRGLESVACRRATQRSRRSSR